MQEPRWVEVLYVMESLRPMNETDGPVMHAETVHRTKVRRRSGDVGVAYAGYKRVVCHCVEYTGYGPCVPRVI